MHQKNCERNDCLKSNFYQELLKFKLLILKKPLLSDFLLQEN